MDWLLDLYGGVVCWYGNEIGSNFNLLSCSSTLIIINEYLIRNVAINVGTAVGFSYPID